jgi:hypothetical protein
MNKEKGEHAAPLGSAESGRLKFVRGAANVTLHVGSGMEDLYRARFDGPVPDIGAEGGAVTVKYTWTLHPFDWRRRGADIALNAQVPWRITVRGGGVSRLEADLGGLQLDSFEVEGGASRVELTLPGPSGTVPIRIDGGASNVSVRRPEGTAARLHVGGGASKLALDDQRFGAIGGETKLESRDYAGATDRYEITITGGANNVAVGIR